MAFGFAATSAPCVLRWAFYRSKKHRGARTAPGMLRPKARIPVQSTDYTSLVRAFPGAVPSAGRCLWTCKERPPEHARRAGWQRIQTHRQGPLRCSRAWPRDDPSCLEPARKQRRTTSTKLPATSAPAKHGLSVQAASDASTEARHKHRNCDACVAGKRRSKVPTRSKRALRGAAESHALRTVREFYVRVFFFFGESRGIAVHGHAAVAVGISRNSSAIETGDRVEMECRGQAAVLIEPVSADNLPKTGIFAETPETSRFPPQVRQSGSPETQSECAKSRDFRPFLGFFKMSLEWPDCLAGAGGFEP